MSEASWDQLNNSTVEKKVKSNAQPLWQLFLLSYATCGFYDLYWFYRNWAQLYPHNRISINPFLRTLGICIPIVGTLLIWFQLDDIQKFACQRGIDAFGSPGWLTIIYLIGCGLVWTPPFEPGYFIFLIMLIPTVVLLIVQKSLNRYWEKAQPGAQIKSLNWFELGVSGLGIVFIILVLIGLSLP